MTSKFMHDLVKAALGLSMIFSFSACDFLKGRPKKNDYIEVNKESLTCLKGLSNKFKAILKSELSESEVDESFTCLDKVLVEFHSRVQGTSDANTFTKADLYEIFNKFLNDAKISSEATGDLLRLKSALLGGNDQTLTKNEITSLKEYLSLVKVEVKSLLPYVKIFNFKKGNKEVSKADIEQAFAQLSLSLKKLTAASLLSHADYRFDDLKKLILNLKILSEDQVELLNLASDLNDVLIGNDLLKTETDYANYITNFSNILKLYSLHLQSYVVFEIKDSAGMAQALDFIEGWVDVLENSHQYKKTKLITAESLDPLIQKIATKGLLPINLKPETLRDFYKLLLVRVFEAGPQGKVSDFDGIKPIHFANLRKEIALYRMYTAFINSLPFPKTDDSFGGRLDISAIQAQLKSMPVSAVADVLKTVDAQTQSELIAYFNELKFEFLQPRPVVYRFGKMVIAANQEIWKQNWNDLARGLYAKMLARELLIGWGSAISNRKVQAATIGDQGIVRWYSEFKAFGIEAKLFDKRTVNAGAKSFKEANLFTYSANGNDTMDYLESVQYLNVLVSGGGNSFHELREGLATAGCNLTDIDKDVFDYFWNKENCVQDEFVKHYNKYFNNLSYLSAYLGKMTDAQVMGFYDAVMNVARTDKNNKGVKVESADLRNFSVLLHYIESLYAQFDVDRNWNFSAAEIRASYPRFKNFATEFAYKNAKDKLDLFDTISANPILGYNCYTREDLIRESFIYLVYHGQTPGSTDLNLAPCVGGRALLDFEGEVNRSDIINTFKILKDVIGS